MRKHFLVLMLLTLLPLAGWAQVDISEFTVTLDKDYSVYTGAAPTITVKVTSTSTLADLNPATDYDVLYYDGETPIEGGAIKSVGTYYVAAKGKGAYTGTTKKVQFNVNPKPLTVKYDGAAAKEFVINYGEANPAIDESKVTFEGFVGTDTKSLISGKLAYTQNNVNANADTDGNILGGKAVYNCTLSGYSAKNYTFTYPTFTMKIKQIALAAASTPADGKNFFKYATDKKGENAFTYSGEKQLPTYTFEYTDAQKVKHTLVLGATKDFTVSYAASEDGTTYGTYGASGVDNTTAKWYKGQIVAVEGGNYSGTFDLPEADFEYQIAKKDVYIYVEDKTKVYDGTAFALADAKIEFNGVVKADAEIAWTYITAKYVDDTNLATVHSKKVTPVVGAGSNILTNYEPQIQAVGVYTISKRPVAVKALNKTVTYGDELGAMAVVYDQATGNTVTIGVADIQAGVDKNEAGVLGADRAAFAAELKLKYAAATSTYNEAKTYEGAIVVYQNDPENAIFANYEFQPTAGNLIINGNGLTLIVKNKTIQYTDEIGEITVLNNLLDGESLGAELAFTYKDKDGNTVAAPEKVGTYEINIVPNKAYAPANYDAENINYVPGTLTIDKKALKVVVKDQTLKVGDTQDVLVQTADYFTITGLKDGENLKYTVVGTAAFSTAAQTITLDPSYIADAITFDITTAYALLTDEQKAAFNNDNYTLADADITKGKLTVVPANTIILKRTEPNLVEFIKNNKGESANQTVLFAQDRTLADEAWNSFVLPFDVKVKDLSRAADYCLVNVLDKKASKVVDGKAQVRFVIEMNEIKANTPFLMKTADARDKVAIMISNVKVVEAATTPVVNEDGDIKFIPLYTRTLMMENDRFPVNANDEVKWKAGNGTGSYLNPLASYVEVPEGVQAQIFVQDFENGVTVIKELGINGNMKGYAVDGWYSLNGVKLQGAPTQKGIYINNGKKVVIK